MEERKRGGRYPQIEEGQAQCVREAMAEFGQSEGAAGRSLREWVRLVREGLPFSEVKNLQEDLGLPMEQLSEKLGISNATLQRRKRDGGALSPAQSDRVLRFARLLGRAIDVFESAEAAREWLKSPQWGLGGAAPLDFADTEIGAREVENLLGRIEHGVFS